MIQHRTVMIIFHLIIYHCTDAISWGGVWKPFLACFCNKRCVSDPSIALHCVGIVSNIWQRAVRLVAGSPQDDERRICCCRLCWPWSHLQWDCSAWSSSACELQVSFYCQLFLLKLPPHKVALSVLQVIHLYVAAADFTAESLQKVQIQ